MIMKSKENRNNQIPTDEPFVENINLVTGDKFIYNRTLLTERQVKQLCIDQKKTSIQKFMCLLKDGEKIQKWSIFENLTLYVSTLKDIMMVLEEIQRNYSHLTEFLPIMGQGFSNYLATNPKYLQKQSILLIFDLTYRTLTQNPTQIDDWSLVLQKITKYPYSEYFVQKSFDFINGSFSMNSSSQRRRTAFCLIKNLMDYSKNIKKLAMTKVLFFNKDQNYKTRCLICQVIGKFIQEGERDQQIWRAVWDYFHDKEASVRQIAHQIICNIYHAPNFQLLIQSISQQSLQSQVCKFLPALLQTYSTQINEHQRSKSQIISFINRVFKSKKIQNIVLLINGLCQTSTITILTQGLIYEEVNFGLLPIKGSKQIFEVLTRFYHFIEDIQFKESLKILLFKNLKQMQYEYFGNVQNLTKIFDFSQDDEISIYFLLCSKMLEFSKWHQLVSLLQIFKSIIFTQNLYEKACSFMLKLWMSCPAFLIDKVIQQIIYLVLINKRSFDFLITIRQKKLNSKFWSHRKNYIKFYSAIRSQTSFQCHKFMPTLMYKNIVADKSSGVRLTFLENAANIYKYTDPEVVTQKGMIKQAINKLQEDKDIYVRTKASLVQNQIAKIDKDVSQIANIYERNRMLIQKQATLTQVVNEPRKVIKTQNQISKSTAKSKRKFGNQQRRTVNVGKIQMHKDMSIDSIALNQQNSLKQATNTTNLAPKKSNLFRCHSVKIKGPPKKN